MSQEPFHIEEVPSEPGERRVLRISGPLWLASVPLFQAELRSDEESALILDLSGVPIIDSAGIAALVAEAIVHQKQGHTMVLVGVSDRVRNTLHVTQVEKFFQFHWTLDEAKAAGA